jgi:hypothetical protein
MAKQVNSHCLQFNTFYLLWRGLQKNSLLSNSDSVNDYCQYRGLLITSNISSNIRIIISCKLFLQWYIEIQSKHIQQKNPGLIFHISYFIF